MPTVTPTRRLIAVGTLVAVVVVFILVWLVAGRGGGTPSTSAATSAVTTAVPVGTITTTPVKTSTTTTTATIAPPVSGVATVKLADLPPEAQHTVKLVLAGGPYPYQRDGVVFENRERHLPTHASGYYHEYTVVTPGASTRGTRRIIKGGRGELFYTDDHYGRFEQVIVG